MNGAPYDFPSIRSKLCIQSALKKYSKNTIQLVHQVRGYALNITSILGNNAAQP